MSSEGIMSFLSLNRSLTNLGDESRHFRLPRMNPFPKLTAGLCGRHARWRSAPRRSALRVVQ